MLTSEIKKEASNRLCKAWSLTRSLLGLHPRDAWGLVSAQYQEPGRTSISNSGRQKPTPTHSTSATKPNKAARNKLPPACGYLPILRYLISLDTLDLVNIWLDGRAALRVLDDNVKREDRFLASICLFLAMDFERGRRAFFYLWPIIFLILVGCAIGTYSGVFHSVVVVLLAVVCYFTVSCLFASAGHSVLDLGDMTDSEGVSQTTTDTDLMGTLAFLGMLVYESLGQLVICFILGGSVGIFLSLIFTLLMLGLAVAMNRFKVCYRIYDARILQKDAQEAARMNRMDEKDKKIARRDLTIKGLRFQSQFLMDLQKVHSQTIEELQMYKNALAKSQNAAKQSLKANDMLRSALARTKRLHDEELAAVGKHYTDEFAKEKAHVEKLARQNVRVEFDQAVKEINDKMNKRDTEVCEALTQRYYAALAKKGKEQLDALATGDMAHADALAAKEKQYQEAQDKIQAAAINALDAKDKEHADAVTATEKQHQEALTKAKADAKVAAQREAADCCRRWILSSVQAAELRHAEALATAISERDKLHSEILAKALAEKDELHREALVMKERECREDFERVWKAQAESHKRVVEFYIDLVEEQKKEHTKTVAEKNQKLEDLKALLDRHPDIQLAEEEAQDFDTDDDDGDTGDNGAGSETVVDDNEAESQDDAESEEEPYDDESESLTDAETECGAEDEESCKVEYEESRVKILLEGDDSEDELRHWAFIDSDFEEE